MPDGPGNGFGILGVPSRLTHHAYLAGKNMLEDLNMKWIYMLKGGNKFTLNLDLTNFITVPL